MSILRKKDADLVGGMVEHLERSQNLALEHGRCIVTNLYSFYEVRHLNCLTAVSCCNPASKLRRRIGALICHDLQKVLASLQTLNNVPQT